MWLHAGNVHRAARRGLIYESVFSVQDGAALETKWARTFERSAKISCPDSTISPLPERENYRWTKEQRKQEERKKEEGIEERNGQ